MDDFPARPKPWTWDVSPTGDEYQIFDVNGNTLLTIKDEHFDREQDLDEIVKCVNEQEQLRARVKELEQENKHLKLAGQHPSQDVELKKELEEKIIRLELYRYDLHQIAGQIRAIDTHAAELKREGQPISLGEKQRQEELNLAWDAKAGEMHKAFPNVELPFAIQEEMNTYCQELVEVNERLKAKSESDGGSHGAPPPPVQERVRSYDDLYQQSTQRKPPQDHDQERGR